MKRLIALAVAAIILSGHALAQTSPNLSKGQVPTAAQWNSYFAAKQDTLGYPALNKNGDTMTGRLSVSSQSINQFSAFNVAPGNTPSAPHDGDMWVTNVGMFVQIAGTTVGPLLASNTSTFTGTTTFNGPAIYNNTAAYNSAVLFNSTATFAGTSTFNGPVTLAGATTASGAVTFNNSTVFNGIPTFNGVSVFTGDVRIGSGKPYCDVAYNGALGNAAHDDSPAWAACDTTLAALNGGVLYAPQGYYCLATGYSSDVTVAITVRGASDGSTRVAPCNGSASVVNDVTVLKIRGSKSRLEHVTVYGKGSNFDPVFDASVPAVIVDSTAGGVVFDGVEVQGGSSAALWLGSDGRAYNFLFSSMLRDANLLIQNNAGLKLISGSTNLGFPVANPAPGIAAPSAWASTHAYSANDIVIITQGGRTYYIQARTPGTSGSSQPALKNYLLDILDGSVNWRFMGPTQGVAIKCDTGCSELFMDKVDDGCACLTAFATTNTLAGAAPHIVRIHHGTMLGFSSTVLLSAGNDVELTSTNLYGCFVNTCSSLGTNSAFTGSLSVIGGEIVNTPGAGVNFTVGSDLRLNGVKITGNSTGVAVAANLSGITVVNSVFQNTTNMTVAAGSGDHIMVDNNNWNGVAPSVLANGTDVFVNYISYKRIGGALVGDWPVSSGTAFFQNAALSLVAGNFGVTQNGSGALVLNAPTGQVIDFRINNSQAWRLNSDSGIFANGVTGSSKGAGTLNALGIYDNGNRVAVSATAPLALNASTGVIAINGLAGSVLAGAGPAFTANPTLGVAGVTPGTLTMAGGTSGSQIWQSAATTTGTITWPSGTVNFSATGGTSQVVQQTSAGGIFTVGQLAASNLSNGTTGSGGGVVLATSPTISAPVLSGTTSATDVTASGTVRANTGFSANGNLGTNSTANVRAAGGGSDCTIIFTLGLRTGGTC